MQDAIINITDIPPEIIAIIAEFLSGDRTRPGNFFEKYNTVHNLFMCNKLFWLYRNTHEYMRELFKNDIAVITKPPPTAFPLIWRIKLSYSGTELENDAMNALLPNVEHIELDIQDQYIPMLEICTKIKAYMQMSIRENLKFRFCRPLSLTRSNVKIMNHLMSAIEFDLYFVLRTTNDMDWIIWLLHSNKISGLHAEFCVFYTTVDTFASALNTNKSLTRLKIVRCTIDNEFITKLTSAIFFNNLTELFLGHANIGDVGAAKIAEALKNTSLTTLFLNGNKISDIGATAIAAALKSAKWTELCLNDNKFGSAGATAIAESLKTHRTLVKLYLSYNNIGDSGATAVSEMLKTNRTMKYLDLESIDISDAGTTAITAVLKTNTTLLKLYLSYNNIKDIGATAIVDALKTNKTLVELYLSYNNIGDIGATAIAEMLKTNTTLVELDISYNNIGDIGSTAINEAMKINTTLTKLYFASYLNYVNYIITDE